MKFLYAFLVIVALWTIRFDIEYVKGLKVIYLQAEVIEKRAACLFDGRQPKSCDQRQIRFKLLDYDKEYFSAPNTFSEETWNAIQTGDKLPININLANTYSVAKLFSCTFAALITGLALFMSAVFGIKWLLSRAK